MEQRRSSSAASSGIRFGDLSCGVGFNYDGLNSINEIWTVLFVLFLDFAKIKIKIF